MQTMSEFKRPGGEHRPTIRQLREQVRSGKTIHEVIGNQLRDDAHGFFAFHRDSLLATAYGRVPSSLDADVIELYGLQPAGPSSLSDLELPRNLAFLSGFSYVVSHFLPTLEEASRPSSGLPVELPIEMQQRLRRFPDAGERYKDSLRSDMVARYLATENARAALAIDPSGATWLEQKARREFQEDNLELTGALKAIYGIRKLYEQLSAETNELNPQE